MNRQHWNVCQKIKLWVRNGTLKKAPCIYDPLGVGAPFLLKGGQIIQQLCMDKLKWDQPINDRSSYDWLKWVNTLPGVNLQLLVCRLYEITQILSNGTTHLTRDNPLGDQKQVILAELRDGSMHQHSFGHKEKLG